MKLHVLVDNNTYIDQYYLGEPGVSYLIETGGHHILFDTGYSDALIKNAGLMQIDLCNVTEIVLSHGHIDHTRGLQYLLKQMDLQHIPLIAHPLCFQPKYEHGQEIGAPLSEETVTQLTRYTPCLEPYYITSNCLFLGQIPDTTSFEMRKKIGTIQIHPSKTDDYVLDDSALVCKTSGGLVIITGCSHSGICNIIEYAKKICRTETVAAVIGGFHLFDMDTQLRETIGYLQGLQLDALYPCHCVSLNAKCEMYQTLPVKEVGVGLSLEYEDSPC